MGKAAIAVVWSIDSIKTRTGGWAMATAKTITPRRTRFSMATGAALIATLLSIPTAAAERPTDRELQQLLERIDNERDRFEDQLDGTLKRSIIRRADREINVEQYLDDLQENVDRMKDRFKPDYAANEEVTIVLRQGSDIQRFMTTQKPDLDGASEWNRLSTSLGELAGAYGISFPMIEGQMARRLNDREVKKAAEDLAKSADRFKKELDAWLKKDATIDQATREAAVKRADDLKKDAEKLASAIDDDRPASGEAQALIQRASDLRSSAAVRTLAPAAQTAWNSVEAGLNTLGHAFSLPTRR
jgi:hypothetical protein